MTEQEVKLVIGGLLHDVGKVIYRTGDGRKHSRSGYDYLKEEIGLEDKGILESVLYHHADALKNPTIADDSNAYVTYIADNIASASDRRENGSDDYGFEMSMPLQPVFNILNGNHGQQYYHPQMLKEKEINYPTSKAKAYDEFFYKSVKEQLSDTLRGIEWNAQYVNSLLSVLETTMGFLPSSTSKKEVADISLYDHVKLTAAVNSCIFQYLQEQGITNYREELYKNANAFYEKQAFLIYSIDLSGIQAFIYTIHSEDALKTLRSRSFYLEIMMEHLIDTVLERLSLSRANLLYSGGGHCYLLLPNTEQVKSVLEEFVKEVNAWLMETYDVALYAATGYAEASANNLKNVPQGSYSELFKTVSNTISQKKAHRYSAAEILKLNRKERERYNRECRICKTMNRINENGLCPICAAMKNASKAIMYEPFFVVLHEKKENALPFPCGGYLIAESEQELRQRLEENPESLIRAYSKNQYYTGLKVATKIWVGNYQSDARTFEELAERAKEAGAIRRIGVLRADVDNMGQAFTAGFSETYNTLSRTATLSRQLSLFFKCYINEILAQRKYRIGIGEGARNATIVYSGGDDLFIVGAWNEVIELAVDIRDAFAEYTEGTLTISAGIGMYTPKYPISQIAYEVGDLEEESKNMPEKNSITILPDGERHSVVLSDGQEKSVADGTYTWEDFKEYVIGEKYQLISGFFEGSEERGTAFLYHLLELIRDRNEKINFARYVYLLARLEPEQKAAPEQKKLYQAFAEKMYQWIGSDEDCRQLKTVMNLYAYMKRERKEQ
mgnify:FL=1